MLTDLADTKCIYEPCSMEPCPYNWRSEYRCKLDSRQSSKVGDVRIQHEDPDHSGRPLTSSFDPGDPLTAGFDYDDFAVNKFAIVNPVISDISPRQIVRTGGQTLTITGTALNAGSSWQITLVMASGKTRICQIEEKADQQIRCKVDRGEVGDNDDSATLQMTIDDISVQFRDEL